MHAIAETLIGRVSEPVELFTVTLVLALALALEPAWAWLPIPLDDAEMPVAELLMNVAAVLTGAFVLPPLT